MTHFTASSSAPVSGRTKIADIEACMAYLKSQPKLVTRIGRAALGRIFTMLLGLIYIKPLLIEVVDDTIDAIFGYLADPDYVRPRLCDDEIFSMVKIEIDKSVARSAKAREAAARRKAIREAAQKQSTTPVSDPQPSPSIVPVPEEAPTPAPIPEEIPVETPEEAPAPKPAKKRREPDTIVSNYRPKKKPLPRYRVLTDEEMNAEPYDPFGAHKAYLIQCRRYGR